MNKTEVFNAVAKIISAQARIEQSKILPHSVLSSDIGLDSLDSSEIAMVLTDELGVEIAFEDMIKIKTIDDLCRVVCEKLKIT